MKNENFWESYNRWEEKAKEEFENGEFYKEEYEHYFEVTESGNVHIEGNLFHAIENAVTPWSESEFYVE